VVAVEAATGTSDRGLCALREAVVARLIPKGFLTLRQAADKIAIAMYSGVPDRPVVKQNREFGFDVDDGAAIDDAISNIWSAVDKGKLQSFVAGPKRPTPLKLSASMSKGIPLLRNPRGGNFNFLRPGKPIHHEFVEWFGPDLSNVSVVFLELEVTRLARTLLRARRRKAAIVGAKKAGRPSLQAEVTSTVREVVEKGIWSATESLKALTTEVNRRSRELKPISDDTVARALDQLHDQMGDRRFERVRRKRQKPLA
jgi:hypothetical protein